MSSWPAPSISTMDRGHIEGTVAYKSEKSWKQRYILLRIRESKWETSSLDAKAIDEASTSEHVRRPTATVFIYKDEKTFKRAPERPKRVIQVADYYGIESGFICSRRPNQNNMAILSETEVIALAFESHHEMLLWEQWCRSNLGQGETFSVKLLDAPDSSLAHAYKSQDVKLHVVDHRICLTAQTADHSPKIIIGWYIRNLKKLGPHGKHVKNKYVIIGGNRAGEGKVGTHQLLTNKAEHIHAVMQAAGVGRIRHLDRSLAGSPHPHIDAATGAVTTGCSSPQHNNTVHLPGVPVSNVEFSRRVQQVSNDLRQQQQQRAAASGVVGSAFNQPVNRVIRPSVIPSSGGPAPRLNPGPLYPREPPNTAPADMAHHPQADGFYFPSAAARPVLYATQHSATLPRNIPPEPSREYYSSSLNKPMTPQPQHPAVYIQPASSPFRPIVESDHSTRHSPQSTNKHCDCECACSAAAAAAAGPVGIGTEPIHPATSALNKRNLSVIQSEDEFVDLSSNSMSSAFAQPCLVSNNTSTEDETEAQAAAAAAGRPKLMPKAHPVARIPPRFHYPLSQSRLFVRSSAAPQALVTRPTNGEQPVAGGVQHSPRQHTVVLTQQDGYLDLAASQQPPLPNEQPDQQQQQQPADQLRTPPIGANYVNQAYFDSCFQYYNVDAIFFPTFCVRKQQSGYTPMAPAGDSYLVMDPTPPPTQQAPCPGTPTPPPDDPTTAGAAAARERHASGSTVRSGSISLTEQQHRELVNSVMRPFPSSQRPSWWGRSNSVERPLPQFTRSYSTSYHDKATRKCSATALPDEQGVISVWNEPDFGRRRARSLYEKPSNSSGVGTANTSVTQTPIASTSKSRMSPTLGFFRGSGRYARYLFAKFKRMKQRRDRDMRSSRGGESSRHSRSLISEFTSPTANSLAELDLDEPEPSISCARVHGAPDVRGVQLVDRGCSPVRQLAYAPVPYYALPRRSPLTTACNHWSQHGPSLPVIHDVSGSKCAVTQQQPQPVGSTDQLNNNTPPNNPNGDMFACHGYMNACPTSSLAERPTAAVAGIVLNRTKLQHQLNRPVMGNFEVYDDPTSGGAQRRRQCLSAASTMQPPSSSEGSSAEAAPGKDEISRAISRMQRNKPHALQIAPSTSAADPSPVQTAGSPAYGAIAADHIVHVSAQQAASIAHTPPPSAPLPYATVVPHINITRTDATPGPSTPTCSQHVFEFPPLTKRTTLPLPTTVEQPGSQTYCDLVIRKESDQSAAAGSSRRSSPPHSAGIVGVDGSGRTQYAHIDHLRTEHVRLVNRDTKERRSPHLASSSSHQALNANHKSGFKMSKLFGKKRLAHSTRSSTADLNAL